MAWAVSGVALVALALVAGVLSLRSTRVKPNGPADERRPVPTADGRDGGTAADSARRPRTGTDPAARRRSPIQRVASRLRAHPAAVLLTVTGIGLGALVGGGHVARLNPPVLADAIEESAVLRAVVTVTADPRMHQPTNDGGRPMAPTWSVPASLESLTVRGRSFTTSVPVLLRGDAARELPFGSRATLSGRAAAPFSPDQYSMTIRILGSVRIRDPPGPVARATTTARVAFRAACSGLSKDAAALLMGLAIGDESLLSNELDHAMVASGLAHLTAVSGSNTSLVAGLAMGLVAALGLGWRTRAGACLLVLAGYVALVRPEPSVLRAAVMGLVALLALTTGGRRRGPPSLLAAVLLLLVVRPQFAVSIGFALSAAATAGLLLIGPRLAERLARWSVTRRLPDPLRAALAVAAAAHVATLPLAVLMGNGVSLVALPANVVVMPLVPVATVLGLAAALVAPVFPWGGAALAHVAAPATAAIAWVARTAAAAPLGVLAVPDGAAGAVAAAVVLAAGGWALRRGVRPWRDRRLLSAALVLLVGVVVVRLGRDARWPPPGWLVLACDVGQGDGLLVRRPGSADALLVDAGPEGAAIADCLADAGVRRLVVLITHFHADHIDGLDEVLAHWPVDEVLTTWVTEPAAGASQVAAIAARRHVPMTAIHPGVGRILGMPVAVLWPSRKVAESPANNGSVVALISVPATPQPLRVLLTGDVEPEAQAALMARAGPAADVVKVPHHGSSYQDPGFARWSGARIALVSVGADNDYGHPDARTLRRYQEVGALVGRTDRDGALAVVLQDGTPALAVQH